MSLSPGVTGTCDPVHLTFGNENSHPLQGITLSLSTCLERLVPYVLQLESTAPVTLFALRLLETQALPQTVKHSSHLVPLRSREACKHSTELLVLDINFASPL